MAESARQVLRALRTDDHHGWDSLVYIKKKLINKMKQFGAISAFIEFFFHNGVLRIAV